MNSSEEKFHPAGGLGNRRSIQLSYGVRENVPQEQEEFGKNPSQREPNGLSSSSGATNHRAGEVPQAGTGRNGHVRSASADTLLTRLWSQVDRRSDAECWPFTGPRDRDGYGRFTFCGQKHSAHRVALGTKLGRHLTADEVTRHSCNHPPCCNPRHLSVGTQADNMADRDRAGRQAKGTRNGRAKLTPKDVQVARRLSADGYPAARIAAFFGVEATTIRHAIDGTNWAHLPLEEASR